jgi:hypothetical protein
MWITSMQGSNSSMFRNICVLFPLALGVLLADTGDISKARQLLRELPIRFEPNAGQWNPRVRFTARTADCSFAFTAREASLSVPGRRIGISLVRSNPSPSIEGMDPLPVRSDYFHGSRENWRTGVANYSRLRYRDVYPGIDMIYYGNRDRLEYDFVLRPGADPNRIRLKFRGAGSVSLTPEGDLLLESEGARLVQKKPLVVQQDRPIAARYRLLGGNEVSVALEAYDRSRALTIDPVLVYSSLLGGSGSDAITAVKVDRAGFVWVAGYTGAGDLTGTDTAYKTSSSGKVDAFVAKIDPKGALGATLLYFTYIGGSNSDMATGMALDGLGRVYLTGTTNSTDFPLAWTSVQDHLGGSTSQDIFILRLNPSLAGADALEYSTYFGGNDQETAGGIDVDQDGNVYLVGTTKSDNLAVTPSAYQNVRWGTQDAFVVKLDFRLNPPLAYSSYLGGDVLDEGKAIAVSPSGAVYIAGTTGSTVFPLAGFPYRDTLQGAYDVFVAKMDLTQTGVASLVYSTYLGGSDVEEARTIALDPSGKVLVGGYTLSQDFPVTADALQSTLAGNADGFVARLDLDALPRNALTYATYLGGTGGDSVYGITGDAAGTIYATGYTLSSDFPVTKDALLGSFGGGIEVFVTRIDPAKGADGLVYSSYLGKTGMHIGYGIAVSGNGTIYVGGLTGIQDVFVSASAAQQNYGGGLSDGFLIVLGPS